MDTFVHILHVSIVFDVDVTTAAVAASDANVIVVRSTQ
jgi:hypothetical protein